MAKPRVFVSSTYYDLRHIRQGVESFINSLGYESILFESGNIPFDHNEALDESCYKEIQICHILVLIIGGRFGSASSDDTTELSEELLERHYQHYNSITKKEFETALTENIPVYIFVEKGVLAEYSTFKENRENTSIKYAHVESVNVFRLLDSIFKLKRNNLTRAFENLDDITTWLRDQWAGLFADFLHKKSAATSIDSLAHQLESLENISSVLKEYSEKIMEGVDPDTSESVKTELDGKLRTKNAISAIELSGLGAHLIKSHDVSSDVLLSAITESTDVDSLFRAVSTAGGGCGRVALGGKGPVVEMANPVRRILGLDEFPAVTEPGQMATALASALQQSVTDAIRKKPVDTQVKEAKLITRTVKPTPKTADSRNAKSPSSNDANDKKKS